LEHTVQEKQMFATHDMNQIAIEHHFAEKARLTERHMRQMRPSSWPARATLLSPVAVLLLLAVI
jgi:hypothetical protein